MQSLQNIVADFIILTWNTKVLKNILYLPPLLLERLDQRCLEIEKTKEYKKRFK
jgi:hypothetical protein